MMNMSAGGKNETLEHLTSKLVEKVGPWEIQNKYKTWQTSSRNDFKEKWGKPKIQYQK